MRRTLFVACGMGLVLANAPAHAIGCLSGGAAGALAGHMAHHGVLGAIGGCIAGHEYHKHQLKQQDLENQRAYQQQQQQFGDQDQSGSR